MSNNKNNSTLQNQNISKTQIVFAKPFLDVSNIEVFFGHNFQCWQELVSSLLDMYGIATTLTSLKPNSSTLEKQMKSGLMRTRYVNTPYLVLVYCLYKEAEEIW